jgi:hypothetical protein
MINVKILKIMKQINIYAYKVYEVLIARQLVLVSTEIRDS